MKDAVRSAVDSALTRLISDERLPADCLIPDFQVEVPKNPDHGDFSCNIAMLLARSAKRPPRELASDLAANLCENPAFSAVNVAGPGFINFVCADAQVFAVVHQVLKSEAAYGRSDAGSGRRVQVEFVSANPTGPLHIGHGRGAAIGSAVAALLEATGHSVTREYYVNDAGRQMDILALSVFLRRMELSSLPVELPLNAYQGDYILEIAQQIEPEIVTKDLGGRWQDWVVSANSQTEADDEATLDVLIAGARQVLGDESFRQIRRVAKDSILQGIRSDLAHFGVEFDVWFSEESLSDQRKVEHAVAALEDRGYLFKDGGAKWFRSTDFGDEKDRVVVRENGSITYFASDIAYHLDKFTRGFSEVINIWGADHHGYVARVKAALSALGLDPGRLEVLLVQFAALVRGGEHVAM
ncbi:MAG: arginine--tRNA ligase, partial [Gammaproteobacteria bacterium]